MIHWEAGNCTTDRQTLNDLILSFPEHRSFTVAKYLGHLNGTEDRQREAFSNSWSASTHDWICPMPNCGARFRCVRVLNQHLESPYHDVNAFKCPNTTCDMRFNCLSGLLQHVENSSYCDESINCGTGCLGRLWLFLLDRFGMLPRDVSPQGQQHFAFAAFQMFKVEAL
jgi:hypothetical protein